MFESLHMMWLQHPDRGEGNRSKVPENKVRQVGANHRSYIGFKCCDREFSFYPGDNEKLLNHSEWKKD